MKWLAVWLGVVLLACVGCSTVTPYTGNVAARSSYYGAITKGDAVNIIRSQARPASGQADSGSFALDEEGFGFKRTTHNTETRWDGGKSYTVTNTVWSTRNVPWGAVKRTSSYFRDYQYVFTDEYVIELTYSSSGFEGGRRTSSDETFKFECRTEADLFDTLAAIQMLIE